MTIVGNERKLSCKLAVKGHPLTLYGFVDRLETELDPDTNERHLTVVDYKTGKVNKEQLRVNMEEPDVPFGDPKYKEFLQLFFYALLCKYSDDETIRKYIGAVPVQCAILSIQDVNMGEEYFHRARIAERVEGRKRIGETPCFTADRIALFEESLKKLLSDIINPEKPFCQTTDADHCKQCDFKHLCVR